MTYDFEIKLNYQAACNICAPRMEHLSVVDLYNDINDFGKLIKPQKHSASFEWEFG